MEHETGAGDRIGAIAARAVAVVREGGLRERLRAEAEARLRNARPVRLPAGGTHLAEADRHLLLAAIHDAHPAVSPILPVSLDPAHGRYFGLVGQVLCATPEQAAVLEVLVESFAAPPLEPAADGPPYLFRHEGATWRIRFDGGEAFTVPHRRGMGYLAELLACPGRYISCDDLFRRVEGNLGRDARAALDSPNACSERPVPTFSYQPVMDGKAQQALDREIACLRQQHENEPDPAKKAEIAEKIEQTEKHQRSSTGLRGRARACPGVVNRSQTRSGRRFTAP